MKSHYIFTAICAIVAFALGAAVMGLAWATLVGENCASMVAR